MATDQTRFVKWRSGAIVPALGMGAWNIGDRADRRTEEIAALRAGVELGLRVIDTAEMYGGGRSETLVGEAIAGLHDEVFLVSKVLPSNASADGVRAACHRSLRRLGVERIGLYLLHWRGGIPLEATLRGFERLQAEGAIGAWGVSNFDVADMEELARLSPDCAANQILYSLDHRGVEFDLLERDAAQGVVTMAYSPLGQGGAMLRHPALRAIARRHETSLGAATPAQIALAFVALRDNVLAIPKAGSVAHLRENVASREIALTPDDLAALNAAFPPPRRKTPLGML